MSDEEFEHYVRLFISMSLDYLGGGLTRTMYLENLDTIVSKIKGEDEEES